MPENLVKIAQNDQGHVGVEYVGDNKVRVFVSAVNILDKLAQFFRTDRPQDWKKTKDGYARTCNMNGAADESIRIATYALQAGSGKKLKRLLRWRSWRSLLKRTTKE